VQLAAADPSGDQSLVRRAAGRLGISARAAAAPAVEAGLIEFGAQVQFRHPLARSAAYWSASLSDRQQMHAALAEMTDPVADPDRRAWRPDRSGPGHERLLPGPGLGAVKQLPLKGTGLLKDDPATDLDRAVWIRPGQDL
jgi:hypothetical protein